jgi:hypothetical protein
VAEAMRCPDCGASNPPDAAWCGQCLRRFDTQTAEAPPDPATPPRGAEPATPPLQQPAAVEPTPQLAAVPTAQRGVRREGDAIVWTCPACETENTMDLLNCSVCGTALAKLFVSDDEDGGPKRSRGSILAMSAVLPGSGHLALGMTAAGLGRAVLYAWTVLVGVFLVLRDVRRNAGMVHGLGLVFILAAVAVWILSFVEASRAFEGDRRLIAAGRSLTWATAALTFLLFVGLALIVRSR